MLNIDANVETGAERVYVEDRLTGGETLVLSSCLVNGVPTIVHPDAGPMEDGEVEQLVTFLQRWLADKQKHRLMQERKREAAPKVPKGPHLSPEAKANLEKAFANLFGGSVLPPGSFFGFQPPTAPKPSVNAKPIKPDGDQFSWLKKEELAKHEGKFLVAKADALGVLAEAGPFGTEDEAMEAVPFGSSQNHVIGKITKDADGEFGFTQTRHWHGDRTGKAGGVWAECVARAY